MGGGREEGRKERQMKVTDKKSTKKTTHWRQWGIEEEKTNTCEGTEHGTIWGEAEETTFMLTVHLTAPKVTYSTLRGEDTLTPVRSTILTLVLPLPDPGVLRGTDVMWLDN